MFVVYYLMFEHNNKHFIRHFYQNYIVNYVLVINHIDQDHLYE